MNDDTHATLVTWLAAYHDGELDEARQQQLEAHLADCAACRGELETLQALSQQLRMDVLPGQALASEAAFWSKLEARLPERAARPTPLRWLPGIGLLMTSGLIQAGAVLALAIILAGPVGGANALADQLNRLAAGLTLGWSAWLIPTGCTNLGLILLFIQLSVWLAVLYLAWLCYEWRYHWRRSTDMDAL